MDEKDFRELLVSILKSFDVDTPGEFKSAYKSENSKLDFHSAVAGGPRSWTELWRKLYHAENSINNGSLPISVRQKHLDIFKYEINEQIKIIDTGETTPKLFISEQVVNRIDDQKLKQVCIEINNTPTTNVISLKQLIGLSIDLLIKHKDSQNKAQLLKEADGFGESLKKVDNIFSSSDNATKRLLKDYNINYAKTGYDMIRHSTKYMPNSEIINGELDMLSHILKLCFTDKK